MLLGGARPHYLWLQPTQRGVRRLLTHAPGSAGRTAPRIFLPVKKTAKLPIPTLPILPPPAQQPGSTPVNHLPALTETWMHTKLGPCLNEV